MATETDPDLTPLLMRCSDEDLLPLRDYILGAATNELSDFDKYNASPDRPTTYIGELVYELRNFGGNTLANIFRGEGVPYREMVKDVAGQLKVRVTEGAAVEDIESAVLHKVLQDMVEKMTPEERARLDNEFAAAARGAGDATAAFPFTAMLLQGGIKMSGFMAYKMAAIVANAVARAVLGRGLAVGANAVLMRVIGTFAGPVGWAVTGLWTLVSAAGPAFRVTVPCVCHIAFLRQKARFADAS